MGDGLQIDPEVVRGHAAKLHSIAANLHAAHQAAHAQVRDLPAELTGTATAAALSAKLEAWETHSQDHVESLREHGKVRHTAVATFEASAQRGKQSFEELT